MASRGLDLDDHVSRTLDPAMVEAADLVVCMARRHLREVVVAVPSAMPKTFTLRELVRRGEAVGPASSLGEWLALVGAGRRSGDLLGDDVNDDVADPIGGPDDDYERTAVQLEDLVARLGRLLDPLLEDLARRGTGAFSALPLPSAGLSPERTISASPASVPVSPSVPDGRKILVASPAAITWSASKYLMASTSAVAPPSWMAWKTERIASASPWATVSCRNFSASATVRVASA
jgi:protein-tyrosine-phosphatase